MKAPLELIISIPIEKDGDYTLEDDKVKSTEFGRLISLEKENNQGLQKVK